MPMLANAVTPTVAVTVMSVTILISPVIVILAVTS